MRAQEYLARHGIGDGEVQSATRRPLLRDGAIDLLRSAERVFIARGRKFEEIDLTGADDARRDELAGRMLGRTGKLRAPTLRAGDAVLVGFHEQMYDAAFAAGTASTA